MLSPSGCCSAPSPKVPQSALIGCIFSRWRETYGSFGFLAKSEGILHSARHKRRRVRRVSPTRRQRRIPAVRFLQVRPRCAPALRVCVSGRTQDSPRLSQEGVQSPGKNNGRRKLMKRLSRAFCSDGKYPVSCLRDVKENTQLLTFVQQGVETSAPFGGVFPCATRKCGGVWRVGSTRGSLFFGKRRPFLRA